MKKSITLASLFLTFFLGQQTFAADSALCKNEALKAAYERYSYEFPESIISINHFGKPVQDDNEIHHTIKIVELDTGIKTVMGVITEKKTCKIIAVN